MGRPKFKKLVCLWWNSVQTSQKIPVQTCKESEYKCTAIQTCKKIGSSLQNLALLNWYKKTREIAKFNIVSKMVQLECPGEGCSAKFTRKFNLNRHYKKYHVGNAPVEKCFLCGQIFNSVEDLSKHFRRYHKPTRKFVLIESAFKKTIVNLRYIFP